MEPPQIELMDFARYSGQTATSKRSPAQNIYGWALVEAQLERSGGYRQACLRGQRYANSAEIFEVFVPVLATGRIHELIRLPNDVTGLAVHGAEEEPVKQPVVGIHRVGWFNRTWRMMNRVFNTYLSLSRQQRLELGLAFWKIIADLPSAYRIATELRGQLFYSEWLKKPCNRLGDQDIECIRQCVSRFSRPPHFHLLLILDSAEQEAIQTTLDSLKKQLFRNFTCIVLDLGNIGETCFKFETILQDADYCYVAQRNVTSWLSQFNGRLAKQSEWVMLLRPGDELSLHALYWFAHESMAHAHTAVLYADDDELNSEKQRDKPRFKPDWSLAHLRATHFIGDAVVLRGDKVAAAGGVSIDCCRHGSYDLLLRVIDEIGDEGKNSVAHIPAVLLHRSHSRSQRISPHNGSAENLESVSQWYLSALETHLARNRVMAEVSETHPGCRRVRYRLPQVLPLVSIIVPTRDQLALIRQCIESLLAKTTYSRFEILVVDNQSSDPEALNYLAQIDGKNGIRILRYDQPFNYSAINNFAVREARGEVLCLLNNDTEVISPDWLEEMVGHLLQPMVGVVGAKLYFPDGRVQHAGDTVGPGGCANHLHSFIERNDPGYCNRAMVAQELSAVTAACLVVWKSLYERLQGLNEKHLAVAFNDVDFCLRVREAGFKVVWTPHAELYHHESVSRGKDKSPEKIRRAKREAAYMRKRWKHVMRNDPFYSPNFSYFRPDFSLSIAPRVTKPWRR